MDSRRSTLQFVLATVILGSLGIFATQAQLDARAIVFYRCLFGAIAMGIYCLLLGHFCAIPKQDFFLAFGSGFLMLGNWVFFFEGIFRIGVSVATIVYQVQPFIVLVVAPTHRKIHFESVDVMRVQNAKITDHWGVGNLLSLLQQIGGWTPPPSAEIAR